MKWLILVLTLVSQIAFAQTNDRKTLDGGVVGILHSENFEYICKYVMQEAGQQIPMTIWIDDNFNKTGGGAPQLKNFRVAHSYPFNERVLGTVGFETTVTSASVGRCLTTCYSIKANVLNEATISYEFKELALNSGKYELKVAVEGENVTAQCELNEVK
ncbi:MAG: hypothetical protein AB7F59_08520 [Bdellovibrionales bacterium]